MQFRVFTAWFQFRNYELQLGFLCLDQGFAPNGHPLVPLQYQAIPVIFGWYDESHEALPKSDLATVQQMAVVCNCPR